MLDCFSHAASKRRPIIQAMGPAPVIRVPHLIVILAAARLADELEHVAVAVVFASSHSRKRSRTSSGRRRRRSPPPDAERGGPSKMRSISASLMAGMTGATITEVDACLVSARSASSRRCGARLHHRAVWDRAWSPRATWRGCAWPCARGCRVARTSTDLVTIPTGWPKRSSTSRMRRIMMLLLDRLVGIGIGPDRDRARRIAGGRKLALEQAALPVSRTASIEIEPRREAEKASGARSSRCSRARSAIGIIERSKEMSGDLSSDDLARGVDRDRGLEWRQILGFASRRRGHRRDRLEAAGGIRLRAAAAPPVGIDRGCGRTTRRRGGQPGAGGCLKLQKTEPCP